MSKEPGAIHPVLDRTEAEAEDPAEALLALSVIDPACGSGHFLLAAARRTATRLARIRAEGTPALADFRHALRDVVRSCIHGVDRNPMAVELTKVALWIETVDPGLPLGFLDAQIRCGDALLGVFDLGVLEQGIPDAAYKPLTGDDKAVARHYAKKNKGERSERAHVEEGFRFGRQHDLVRAFAAMRAMPEDTLDQIAAKSTRLNALTQRGTDSWVLSRACYLYVAAFLAPKLVLPTTAGPDGLPRRGAETVPTSGTMWELLRGVEPYGLLVQNTARALDDARAFHWPLEFPDIMARGGFDVVLGNPPWEVMQLSEKEYFATRQSEIAALTGAARKRAISDLEYTDPAAFRDYVAAKRMFDAGNQFARETGRFDRTARGKVNTYSLFRGTIHQSRARARRRYRADRNRHRCHGCGLLRGAGRGKAAGAIGGLREQRTSVRRRASQLQVLPPDRRPKRGCGPFRVFPDRPRATGGTGAELHPEPRTDRGDQPQYAHRARIPFPCRCGADSENLCQRPGADRRRQRGQGQSLGHRVSTGLVQHDLRLRPLSHRAAASRGRFRARGHRLGVLGPSAWARCDVARRDGCRQRAACERRGPHDPLCAALRGEAHMAL